MSNEKESQKVVQDLHKYNRDRKVLNLQGQKNIKV